jgi:exonuclease III
MIFIEVLKEQNSAFDIICLQETWTQATTDLSLIQLNGYALVSQPATSSTHGGVAIYTKNSLTFERITSIQTATWEAQFVRINNLPMKTPLIIGNIYRPPHNDINNLTNFIDNISEHLQSFHHDCIIAGDYNIDLLKIHIKNINRKYLESIISVGYTPLLTFPTRFSTHSASLIDNFLSKTANPKLIHTSGILTNKLSDHQPCFTCINIKTKKPKEKKYVEIKQRPPNFYDLVKKDLQELNIITKLSDDPQADPNQNYSIFEDTLTALMQKHTKIKTVKFNKHKHKKCAWITNEIINSIKFRDKLHLRWKRSQPNSQIKETLKINISTYNKIIKKQIRIAKIEYYSTIFQQLKDDPKNTWKEINRILSQTPTANHSIEHLNIAGTKIVDSQNISNHLNDFFANAGNRIASQIEITRTSFKDYLGTPTSLNFNFDHVSETTIQEHIRKLKNKSSTSADGINTILIKTLIHEISKPLTLIANQMINTGIFPDRLKLAKITPIFKKGDPHECGNYRPISILPTISKVFEKIILSQLNNYFDINNLHFNSQYGFRKKRSTELAALELIDTLSLKMDQNKTPISIFLDLSKAFDSLHHNILLTKLKHYGITQNSLTLITNYLSNRQQYTHINGSSSHKKTLTTGVPQGSILGPFLFLIYVNDFNRCTKHFSMIHYADDTTLTTTINTAHTDTSDTITNNLSQIYTWLCANKLALNISKTKFMIFHTPQTHIILPNLQINNIQIHATETFNFLGISLTHHLNWNTHIKKISMKIARVTGIINKLKNHIPQFILLTIYNALIVPHLNYGILLWGHNPSQLLPIQKRAIRAITLSSYNSHTDPLFRRLNVLKITDIRKMSELKFYYKYTNNNLPEYFLQSYIQTNRQTHAHPRQTRHENMLSIPPHRHHFFKSNLRYTLVHTVNNLPPHIKSLCHTHSTDTFTKRAKAHIINQYSTICTIPNCYICHNR